MATVPASCTRAACRRSRRCNVSAASQPAAFSISQRSRRRRASTRPTASTPTLVLLSDNHPDLIAVLPGESGGRLLRIIDLKRGERLKLTHRVQILFYALELQALLDAEGIDARVDLEHGGVWLGKQPEPEVFDLGDFRPHLERFLRHDLGRILASRCPRGRNGTCTTAANGASSSTTAATRCAGPTTSRAWCT